MDESGVKLLFLVEIMPAINDRQRENLVQISSWLKLDSESLYLKREILRVAIHYVCFFFTA